MLNKIPNCPVDKPTLRKLITIKMFPIIILMSCKKKPSKDYCVCIQE